MLFSDESQFNLFGSDGRQWCEKRVGEEFLPRNVKKQVKHGEGCITPWGCLHCIKGNMDHCIHCCNPLLQNLKKELWAALLLRPCLSPTGPVGPIRSDPESGRQVHGNGCEGFSEVIDLLFPEEDAKCLQFTRLRIGLYRNKLQ